MKLTKTYLRFSNEWGEDEHLKEREKESNTAEFHLFADGEIIIRIQS